jgi:hypothetical protein
LEYDSKDNTKINQPAGNEIEEARPPFPQENGDIFSAPLSVRDYIGKFVYQEEIIGEDSRGKGSNECSPGIMAGLNEIRPQNRQYAQIETRKKFP